jgi:hypothetical protein
LIFGKEYISLSSALCSFIHSAVTSSLLGPNILLSTVFSNTLSLSSSLNVMDQVSLPYKTRKIVILYTLFFRFLDGKLDDKRVSSLHKSKILQKRILSDTVEFRVRKSLFNV